MLFYGSVAEGLAYLEATDEDYADYAGRVYAAAARRGEDEPGDDTS